MAIPNFQAVMLPALRSISLRPISDSKGVIRDVVKEFKLTEEELAQLLPSKTQRVIDNRVYWSLVYLAKAGLIDRPSRGQYEITDRGKQVLKSPPVKIDIAFLMQFPEFKKFREIRNAKVGPATQVEEDVSGTDPLETFEDSYQKLRSTIVAELLEQVRNVQPSQFERLVIELLKKMGYGVPELESAVHTGKSGDGGIDGEISQDPLGLDMIYIQAKKYQEGSGIGRPMIQQFVGSLNERKANKGIFITTSHFSSEAKEYINRIDIRVVLIDGLKLAELMYDYDLGVTKERVFEVKRIDADYLEGLES